MVRREWNIGYQREVVFLRTVLAYPEGTTPYLQERGVLDDVIDAYPAVWQFAIHLDHATQKARGRFSLLRRSSPLLKRLPLHLFRVFVGLGRQEMTEREAVIEISRFFCVP